MHERVLPRDLFNEAKLLKCLGRLSLLKHEKQSLPYTIDMNENTETNKFIVRQDQDTGDLYVANILCRAGRTPIGLNIPYFAPDDPWPLRMVHDNGDEWEETTIFDNSGNITDEAMAKLEAYAAKRA